MVDFVGQQGGWRRCLDDCGNDYVTLASRAMLGWYDGARRRADIETCAVNLVSSVNTINRSRKQVYFPRRMKTNVTIEFCHNCEDQSLSDDNQAVHWSSRRCVQSTIDMGCVFSIQSFQTDTVKALAVCKEHVTGPWNLDVMDQDHRRTKFQKPFSAMIELVTPEVRWTLIWWAVRFVGSFPCGTRKQWKGWKLWNHGRTTKSRRAGLGAMV